MRIVLGILLLLSSLWAQEENKYLRKSISHLDVLFRLDRSSQALSLNERNQLIRDLNSQIKLGRFDFNPIPKTVVDRIIQEGRDNQVTQVRDLEALLNSTLAPQLSQVVLDSSMERSEGIQSASQRESFMALKAKSLDVTAEQYQKILNASYVYIPTISSVKTQQIWGLGTRGYEVSLELGLAWFQLKFDDQGNSKFHFLKHVQSYGLGRSASKRHIDHRLLAYEDACRSAIRNLVFETQSDPAFKLRGQVLEGGMKTTTLDLGKESGLELNQRFRLFEMIETQDTVIKNDIGWGFVSEVDTEGQSQLTMISGFSDQGQSMEEIPLSGLNIQFGYSQHSWEIEKPIHNTNPIEARDLLKIYVGVGSDRSESSGWNSTSISTRFSLALANYNDSLYGGQGSIYKLGSMVHTLGEFLFTKNFHLLNRFYVGYQLGVGMYYTNFFLDDLSNETISNNMSWTGNTFRADLIGSFEISPRWSLIGSWGVLNNNVWYQEYEIDGAEAVDCGRVEFGCFDADYQSTQFSLSMEYRLGKVSDFFQQMF